MPKLLNTFPQLSFVLLGEGPQRNNLEQLAKRLAVADRVEIRGWVEQEAAIHEMARSEWIVMPSRSVQEGFGLALAEAMLSGRPVIASDIEVFQEVAGKGLNTVAFFKEGDSSSLADVLRTTGRVGNQNRQMIDNARQRVRENFSSETMAKQYLQLYRQLIERKNRTCK